MVIVRDSQQRHGLGIGRSASLNERARIGITSRDHTVKRRGDLRVTHHRLKFIHIRLGGGNGSGGGQVIGFGRIEFLLGDQIGMFFVDRRSRV